MEELLSKASGTREKYLFYFQRFLERWGLSADELFEMRLKDLRSGDPLNFGRIERWVKAWCRELVEAGYSPGTCRLAAHAVKSFFKALNLPLNLKASDLPKGESSGSRIVLREEILALWDACGGEFKKRNRAILMFLKDSGLRISDVVALTVGQYRGAKTIYNEFGEPFKVFEPIQTKKTGSLAFVHIGPEAIKAVDDYLRYREEREGPLPPGAPLFSTREGDFMQPDAITMVFNRLRRSLGREGYRISPHSLRKFHTTLLEAEIPRHWLAKLQGKKVNDSMGPYSQPEFLPGTLTEAYMQAYHRIRVFKKGETDRKAREEVVRLQARIAELESRIKKMEPAYRRMMEAIERMQRWKGESSEVTTRITHR